MTDNPSRIAWYPGNEILVQDIVRAENCHLYDSSGKRYVDLESGVWCTSVGHNNPRVSRAIVDQLALIAHTGFNYTSKIVQEAAHEVLSLLGIENGLCVFLCSGSEAVEYGVRVAQSLMDRPLIMTMADSYFGAYGSAAGRDDREWSSFDWFVCAECEDNIKCDENCEHWARIPFERIGAFLFEPGSSSGLVRFPPAKLIRSIAGVVRKNGGLILVNEVTTGIGRTGRWFGFQHYDLSPDIVALGKGIGNGYPVSVTACSPRVADQLRSRSLKYAQSHQNDPLGAAVALEVIRSIRDGDLITGSRVVANRLVSGLEEIKTRTGRIKEVRARGLMLAIELHDDADDSLTIRTHRELGRRGFLVGRRSGVSTLRLDPSLTVELEDIEDFLKTFEQVLAT